ncbi:MAG: type II toxin-antitoxin system HipA family toxin [Acidiferrobacterales bacterium]|nr:type II toxin-antitoxin system HipA family toxin [Acidiferrobacterales bacterium]
MTTASVELWGRQIGAVTWLEEKGFSVFEYTPEFVASHIQVSPIVMPLREAPYQFPTLPRETFKGLPGMLADSLPDKFGNALIDIWLARQGRLSESFNPVERLCYTGSRGMGALEFQPALKDGNTSARKLELQKLVELASQVLTERKELHGKLGGNNDSHAIEDILRVGTSAGGARAKAILAWNPKTGEFRSGQVDANQGFSYWLMKFDGVDGNRDKELNDPMGYGRIEFAYYLMAREAGINMMPSRLHEEGGRAHFMTQRYDRTPTGGKLHYQSLGALMHYDFESAGAHSYEQAILAMRSLKLPLKDIEQQVLRTFFNIIGRNQDDHVKNIGFLMNQSGQWRLSPAFDVVYSYNPGGDWTAQHQMQLNGKRNQFDRKDLWSFGQMAGLKQRKVNQLIERVIEVVTRWPEFASQAKVFDEHVSVINRHLRLRDFPLHAG